MIFEYSLWWVIPILILSVGVARLKFKKISKLPDIPVVINILISFLRFLVVFILFFLLLQPALQLTKTIKEKPLLLVAQDNSMSLLNTKDSLYFLHEYEASLKKQLAPLYDRFSVEWLTFGKKAEKNEHFTFSEHHTNITGLFDYIDNQYLTRKPEGVLLLSDGRYNHGMNPRYQVNSYPVYTVVLGDTTEVPDVYIKEVIYDKFNFLHTIFPIKVEIAAWKQRGEKLICLLKEDDRIIGKKELTVDRDDYITDVVFDVEARKKGVVRYTVELETNFIEKSRENNQATVYVNILDHSGDIAIYYTAPHPDIAAITSAVEASGVYKCTHQELSKPLKDLQANLFILHNPQPENPNYRKIIQEAEKRNVAVWYILTGRKNILDFSRYTNEYGVSFTTGMNEYALPAYNRNFSYFGFTEEEAWGFMNFPPLIVPFGQIKTNAGKNLFVQKIKSTVTENGMMSFYSNNKAKQAYFWGEGLWKWRLFSYKENGNHDLFNTLIHKTVNYLVSRTGSDRFIHDINALYDETEDISVDVELYNDSYELVNTPDVRLVLEFEGKEYQYLLNRNEDKYRINLGNLSAGEYHYKLSTDFKGEKFEKKGVFYVRTQNPELKDMRADARLMQEIADNSGGKSCFYADIDELITQISTDSQFTPMYKAEIRYVNLGELEWAGIILLLLVCIEWMLLKYYVG